MKKKKEEFGFGHGSRDIGRSFFRVYFFLPDLLFFSKAGVFFSPLSFTAMLVVT